MRDGIGGGGMGSDEARSIECGTSSRAVREAGIITAGGGPGPRVLLWESDLQPSWQRGLAHFRLAETVGVYVTPHRAMGLMKAPRAC